MAKSPNRHQRRANSAAISKRQAETKRISERRLINYQKLSSWKASEKESGKLTTDQIDTVFKVILSRMLKKDLTLIEVTEQIKSVRSNVKLGFNYFPEAAVNTVAEPVEVVSEVAST